MAAASSARSSAYRTDSSTSSETSRERLYEITERAWILIYSVVLCYSFSTFFSVEITSFFIAVQYFTNEVKNRASSRPSIANADEE